MKINDLFTKRFLAVCLGISAILLSGSVLVVSFKSLPSYTTRPADNSVLTASLNHIKQATSASGLDSAQAGLAEEDIHAVQVFGMGIREGIMYFGILYNNNTIGLHKTEFNSEDVIHW